MARLILSNDKGSPDVKAIVIIMGVITASRFVSMMAVVGLHTLFYLTLTLLMGVLTNSRGVVLAVTLGSLLGGR